MIKTRRFSGPSLTPMIDVVFLLLLFFLLSSQLSTQETIALDIAGEGASTSDVDLQLIELGTIIYLNGEEVSTDDLEAQLRALNATQTSIAIRAEQSVTYGETVKMVDQLHTLGFENIVLVENTNES